ncbi:pyridoxal-dependent decarboxylase, exosortase A system-associated [Sandaracinobacter sp. RS1-74]|uniref:pyridoxal-dependent decarboxylase, exosortase A system-associated n=1 Tax=Sandaracinobacteroides sayramensis TaxID=2913411 RepID=UPI001EDAE778|nr:pyridoxal-dependent decarboxylase, exosortase A system-associated [Sandaracinobacteroides sayramensis]MCG2842485.1 pyridoxal-dependent decarboxylase, exosortase A system-associated [Sandaracinobacteroides sayramensis]
MSGHIPEGFPRGADGRLHIAGRSAADWVAEAGDTPLFLYDRALLTARARSFRAAMPEGLGLHFAIKANPLPELLRHMAGLVDGFDIASGGELERALAAGMPATRISFAGPGKRDRELEAAIAAGVALNVESAGELDRAGAIALRLGQKARVALRVNPPFALKGSGMKMGGVASPFGVDAAAAPELLRAMQAQQFRFEGLHLFAGSQNLSVEAILESQRQSVELAGKLTAEAELAAPPLVNLGGGFGVPYFPGDRELDLQALGRGLAAILAERPAILGESRFALELGRWLVAEAGVYLCRIVDRKQSGGETFLVTDGGLHHQLAATGNFGTVIRRNYPLANASRDGGEAETATVVGCLCTPLDRLAEKASLPISKVGDLIAVFMAGAYGRTASPENFLGHPPAIEKLV